ncbi:MAG: DUF1580 domain-containing protein [Pirellulaceae bacterium]|nr:DUF1580 domain-containing protein [Pirellulaceae bacterium]
MNDQHIDLIAETVIPINKAARHYPYGRPSLATVYRHLGRGCRGARLESFVAGGRRYTTVEAIRRFVAQTTANSPGAPLPPSRPTNRQREAEIRKAESEATAAGI